MSQLKWSYGVTTVPSRRATYLPRTLQSLEGAGFAEPRLFVDGCSDPTSWNREFDLHVTTRWPAINAAANWCLSLSELYFREPLADLYAIFQDDLLACRNLREYLERYPLPGQAYFNLYAFRENDELARRGKGFVEAAPLLQEGTDILWQTGRGAVALVFPRAAVQTLLSSRHMADRPTCLVFGKKRIDGGIVTAMNKAGYREHVHCPSLVQHQGLESTISDKVWRNFASTFPGEGFDALSLLK